ncbi:MAG: NADH-quinone oxidoreductase subunit NuoH [Planctomycetes bacterium]|nr:NADH-quinone oxidoreductase subunit NuoH [Planctomycetota bacterium]
MILLAVKVLLALAVLMTCLPLLVYLERKIAAYCQGRIGPNRVGPFGLFQPVADVVKLFFKEDITPRDADKGLYYIAPVLAMLPGALAFAIVPFGSQVEVGGEIVRLQIADFEVGILFALAALGLSVYGVSFGGWASASKYALLGGVRSSAQLVSYEVGLSLAVIGVLMVSGTTKMSEIVLSQTGAWWGWLPQWNVFRQPVAFLVFLVAMFAENQRLPFDLPEAEPELVAGFHTEYSSAKFALFFMGEYMAMITMSALAVTLFFGGWHFPGIPTDSTSLGAGLLTSAVFVTKVWFFLFLYIFVRWALPRFRYDQVMQMGWKVLVPVGLANLAVTATVGVLR